MINTLTGATSPNARAAKQQVILKAALAVLAVSALPTASAQRDCWIDSFGRRRCRLSVGARIAIAVSITVACLLLILAIGLARRRRVARANQAYVTAQQHQQAHPYGNQEYQYGNSPYQPYDPSQAAQYQQYPPPGAGQGFYNPQGSQGGFAPPPGPPPGQPPQYQEYIPPRSPPPAAKS